MEGTPHKKCQNSATYSNHLEEKSKDSPEKVEEFNLRTPNQTKRSSSDISNEITSPIRIVDLIHSPQRKKSNIAMKNTAYGSPSILFTNTQMKSPFSPERLYVPKPLKLRTPPSQIAVITPSRSPTKERPSPYRSLNFESVPTSFKQSTVLKQLSQEYHTRTSENETKSQLTDSMNKQTHTNENKILVHSTTSEYDPLDINNNTTTTNITKTNTKSKSKSKSKSTTNTNSNNNNTFTNTNTNTNNNTLESMSGNSMDSSFLHTSSSILLNTNSNHSTKSNLFISMNSNSNSNSNSNTSANINNQHNPFLLLSPPVSSTDSSSLHRLPKQLLSFNFLKTSETLDKKIKDKNLCDISPTESSTSSLTPSSINTIPTNTLDKDLFMISPHSLNDNE